MRGEETGGRDKHLPLSNEYTVCHSLQIRGAGSPLTCAVTQLCTADRQLCHGDVLTGPTQIRQVETNHWNGKANILQEISYFVGLD